MAALQAGKNLDKHASLLPHCESSSEKDEGPKAQPKPQQSPTSGQKRKASLVITDDDKENDETPSTPPPAKILKKQPTTPGRVGPMRRDDPKCEAPDPEPFKGPKGKRVRKTRAEKDEEFRKFARENEGHCFHELYVCFDKGPKGSPTFDKSGFELDYNKVAAWMRPQTYNKSRMVNGMERRLAQRAREKEVMAKIFFEKGEAPTKTPFEYSDYWKDRVSKDLNVPWHHIGVSHFEEWEKRGFPEARKGEYESVSKEERDRMFTLMSGASLRK